jgi:hypothetical protein
VTADLEPCWGCGALVPRGDGPTHRYIGASAGCWQIYAQIEAKSQMMVDAYAAQHPGVEGPQATQSVAVHLMSLCAQLERGLKPEHATRRMQAYLVDARGQRRTFTWLTPPPLPGAVTILDIAAAYGNPSLDAEVRRWASEVWSAWAPYHHQVRSWLDQVP